MKIRLLNEKREEIKVIEVESIEEANHYISFGSACYWERIK